MVALGAYEKICLQFLLPNNAFAPIALGKQPFGPYGPLFIRGRREGFLFSLEPSHPDHDRAKGLDGTRKTSTWNLLNQSFETCLAGPNIMSDLSLVTTKASKIEVVKYAKMHVLEGFFHNLWIIFVDYL
jgi:hypothetical protein